MTDFKWLLLCGHYIMYTLLKNYGTASHFEDIVISLTCFHSPLYICSRVPDNTHSLRAHCWMTLPFLTSIQALSCFRENVLSIIGFPVLIYNNSVYFKVDIIHTQLFLYIHVSLKTERFSLCYFVHVRV